jgi:hypothetical protein
MYRPSLKWYILPTGLRRQWPEDAASKPRNIFFFYALNWTYQNIKPHQITTLR